MNQLTFDPSEYIKGLQQLLISDKKKIAFLLGAGTSLSKKNDDSKYIPAMGRLTEIVENKLKNTPKYQSALQEIKLEIGKGNYNIETLLSNLEQKKDIIGSGTLNGLVFGDIEGLISEVKMQILEEVSVHQKISTKEEVNNLIQVDFAEWIGRADRKYPIEIFTTNYDYLFELGMEENNIPYYDGFTGSYRPFFNPESVADLAFLPNQAKIWKIHGSLGWQLDTESLKVLRMDSDVNDILIYPSTLKYNDSRKQPYVALMDRLTNYLMQPDAVLIVCGYSFGDEHINERILTALSSNTSAHVYALYYDVVWNGNEKRYSLEEESQVAKLAKKTSKLSIFGSRSAVIGGRFGRWKLKREPDIDDTININHYFDEDAPFNLSDPLNTDKKGQEIWTGEGELLLPNFVNFVNFLQTMIFFNDSIGGKKE